MALQVLIEATLVKHHNVLGAAGLVPSHAWPNFHSNVLCYWHHTARRYGRFIVWSVLLIAEGLITLAIYRHDGTTSTAEDAVQSIGVGRWLSVLLILLWIVILATSIAIRQSTSYGSHKVFHWWETFYHLGSLTFSGGQVGSSFLLPQIK